MRVLFSSRRALNSLFRREAPGTRESGTRPVARNDFREFISRKSINSKGPPQNRRFCGDAVSPPASAGRFLVLFAESKRTSSGFAGRIPRHPAGERPSLQKYALRAPFGRKRYCSSRLWPVISGGWGRPSSCSSVGAMSQSRPSRRRLACLPHRISGT